MRRMERIFKMADEGKNALEIGREIGASARTVGVYLKYRRQLEQFDEDGYVMAFIENKSLMAVAKAIKPKKPKRTISTQFDDELAREIIRLYVDEAMTVHEIGARLHVWTCRISAFLDERKVPRMSPVSRPNDQMMVEIQGYYRQGVPIPQIAKNYHCSANQIRKWLGVQAV